MPPNTTISRLGSPLPIITIWQEKAVREVQDSVTFAVSPTSKHKTQEDSFPNHDKNIPFADE